jgi:hypothetical protein
MTVGTLKHRVPPELGHALDGRWQIHHAGTQQHATHHEGLAPHPDLEGPAGAADVFDTLVTQLDGGIGQELLAAHRAKLIGRCAITGDEVVDVFGPRIAARPPITQQHPLARAAQGKGGREPGGAAADDEHIMDHGTLLHRSWAGADPAWNQERRQGGRGGQPAATGQA